MNEVITIGVDLAKSVFQVHGVDAEGTLIVRRQFRRGQVLPFSETAPLSVGMEACATYLSRIDTHAANGSSNWPPRCFSQVKLPSAAGCPTLLPLLSAGVFPSSVAWVLAWLK